MSFPITDHVGLRVTGLNIARSAFTAGAFIGMYFRSTSGYIRGVQMYSDEDGARPLMGLALYADRTPWMNASRAGGSNNSAFESDPLVPSDTWTLVWGKWDSSTGDLTAGSGDAAGATDVGPDDWETAGSENIKAIGVGIWRAAAGDADEYSTASAKIALPFIAKRHPTSGELTELTTGQGHPLAVFGADLLDYWPPDSKTSAVNGWVLSDVSDNSSTVTIDTGDNPTVDDPPASESQAPRSMHLYRQMMGA